MQFGDLEIHVLSDGLVRVDAGGPFGLVPRALYGPIIEVGPDNDVAMALHCLLIRSGGKTILVDTGIGAKLRPEQARSVGLTVDAGHLLPALDRIGLTAADVDIVINTHLHADHCGGNTFLRDGAVAATFPNATYLVQRLEWAEACHPDERTRRTYLAENFAPLVAQGRMRLLHGETQVTDHVRCVVTPGHTRGHQSVLFSSGHWSGFFAADLASYAAHFARTAWLTAYDVLPLENLRTKQRWQQWALDQGSWIFIQHDPLSPVVRLARREGRLEAQRVEEAEPVIGALPTPRQRRG